MEKLIFKTGKILNKIEQKNIYAGKTLTIEDAQYFRRKCDSNKHCNDNKVCRGGICIFFPGGNPN